MTRERVYSILGVWMRQYRRTGSLAAASLLRVWALGRDARGVTALDNAEIKRALRHALTEARALRVVLPLP